jgi:hypothetical protein
MCQCELLIRSATSLESSSREVSISTCCHLRTLHELTLAAVTQIWLAMMADPQVLAHAVFVMTVIVPCLRVVGNEPPVTTQYNRNFISKEKQVIQIIIIIIIIIHTNLYCAVQYMRISETILIQLHDKLK